MKSDFVCKRAEVTESQLEAVRAAFFTASIILCSVLPNNQMYHLCDYIFP